MVKKNVTIVAAAGLLTAGGIWVFQTQTNSKLAAVQPKVPVIATQVKTLPVLNLALAVKACKPSLLKKYNKSFDENSAQTNYDKTGIIGSKFIWYAQDFKCEVDKNGDAVLSQYSNSEIETRLNEDCKMTARRAGYNDPSYKFEKIKINKDSKGLILTGTYGGQSFQCTSYDPAAFQAEFADGGVDYFIGREGDRQNREAAAQASLLINSWHCNLDGDYMKFVGEVTNQTSTAMTNIEAVGMVYDKDGLVDTAEALIDYHNLRPGEKSPFSTLVDTGGRGTNCQISFKTFDGTPVDSFSPPK